MMFLLDGAHEDTNRAMRDIEVFFVCVFFLYICRRLTRHGLPVLLAYLKICRSLSPKVRDLTKI